MDVLNKGDEYNAGQIRIVGDKWGCALGFKQDPKQKKIRGVVVACPKAARAFAAALLKYAEEEEAANK